METTWMCEPAPTTLDRISRWEATADTDRDDDRHADDDAKHCDDDGPRQPLLAVGVTEYAACDEVGETHGRYTGKIAALLCADR
ncbi:MAG: hypothetical protein IPN85_18280 [Flavobacteriales bacterium]|nr:hypothetical protein [Flavobacteriales bacterium]